ncbi:hypothetical protein HYH03_018289 [Edaphochlamys debaryana]|uniref:Uncharacterized protein n=1 Tax=Edaphochlamys debaryana TaxID=47281 RepID=A0A836BPJ2_9CHLO|nr:hypothetical protein HYH03_018289 [Edaphochlamys debaryana]|eukprot:KAG2482799.1 hypothetical protein HYH03_018289 [Edaphochlamys debaryana]
MLSAAAGGSFGPSSSPHARVPHAQPPASLPAHSGSGGTGGGAPAASAAAPSSRGGGPGDACSAPSAAPGGLLNHTGSLDSATLATSAAGSFSPFRTAAASPGHVTRAVTAPPTVPVLPVLVWERPGAALSEDGADLSYALVHCDHVDLDDASAWWS